MSHQIVMQQPSVIAQNAKLSTYTIILLGFKITPNRSKEVVLASLKRTCEKLVSAFPFLGGKVVQERGDGASTTGIFRTVPYKSGERSNHMVIDKDVSEMLPSFDEIVKQKAPISMLDGKFLSPKRGFGFVYDAAQEELPVLELQANFVKGGLLLCFASQHVALDMNGQGEMIRHFATLCRGEVIAKCLLQVGNADPDDFIPRLAAGQERLSHSEIRVPSSLGQSVSAPAMAGSWKVYRISASVVKELKSSTNSVDGWVSTNDIVSALLWKCLTVSRRARHPEVETITIARAVTGRKRVKPVIPAGYMGHYVAVAASRQTVEDVKQKSVGELATVLRKGLDEVDDYYMKSLASTFANEPDNTTFNYGATMKTPLDFMLSSWAGLGLSESNFGELGDPLFVRRPLLDVLPGLVYILPRTRDGDWEMLLCFSKDELLSLENFDLWREKFETIG